MGKLKDFKASCRKKLDPKELHQLLGLVLKGELRDRQLFASEDPQKRKTLPSSQIPFLP